MKDAGPSRRTVDSTYFDPGKVVPRWAALRSRANSPSEIDSLTRATQFGSLAMGQDDNRFGSGDGF